MRFIGDIHGKVGEYEIIAEGADSSVQIGDFGYGWFSDARKQRLDQFHGSLLLGDHQFIRGNHDDPAQCKEASGWIEDGRFDEKQGIMYVGGAWSIDWARRTPGVSWWHDEELSQEEFDIIHTKYVDSKPRIMVTHDAPDAAILASFEFPNYFGDFKPTRTSAALQRMFEAHKPDLWIFGHWHIHVDHVVEGTRFICLEELQAADVDPITLSVEYPQY